MSLRLLSVGLCVGESPLVEALTLEIKAGSVATVMGPSGAGKSSLLAFACGTLPPGISATGTVWCDDIELTRLPPHRRRLGILFQDDLLFPHLSVGDNLAFGLQPAVRGRRARRSAIEAALTEAELPGFAERDPATLSGGERVRVALMRCLLARPRALLLDEPFSRLDAELRARFRRFVFAAARARQLPVLLVTHDVEDAAAAGGIVVRIGADDADRVGRAQSRIDAASGWTGRARP